MTELPFCIFRTWAGLSVGYLIYIVSIRLSKIDFNIISKILFMLVEEGLLLYVVFATYNNDSHYKFFVSVFFISMVLMTSGMSFSTSLNLRKLELGNISMIIYIFHNTIADCINDIKIDMIDKRIVLIIVCVVFAIVANYVTRKLRNNFTVVSDILKKIFLKTR